MVNLGFFYTDCLLIIHGLILSIRSSGF